MSYRPLIINEAFKRRVAAVKAYAQAHPYIPGETLIPGDNPRQTIRTKYGYRIVFSYSRMPNALYRDLSISVDSEGKWPDPFGAFTIAQCFGFTGWDGETLSPPPSEWLIAKDIHFNAIRIAQPIETWLKPN